MGDLRQTGPGRLVHLAAPPLGHRAVDQQRVRRGELGVDRDRFGEVGAGVLERFGHCREPFRRGRGGGFMPPRMPTALPVVVSTRQSGCIGVGHGADPLAQAPANGRVVVDEGSERRLHTRLRDFSGLKRALHDGQSSLQCVVLAAAEQVEQDEFVLEPVGQGRLMLARFRLAPAQREPRQNGNDKGPSSHALSPGKCVQAGHSRRNR